MHSFYPLLLKSSLHETIWGGRRLERDKWKQLPQGDVAIGESWETEVSTLVQNGSYAGKTLGNLVDVLDRDLLGRQAVDIFGHRFPLLAKFIDANSQLSVQVHPDDTYAAEHAGGKLGKTEFWYILAAEPGSRIVHGFKAATSRAEVQSAIEHVTLDKLLHEEVVYPCDIIFVPAGTVHAIGSGVMLFELQEYSDITYRMYDYGRLTTSGKPRELHIERSLDVTRYELSHQIKTKPVTLVDTPVYTDRCLVACRYFVTREVMLKEQNDGQGSSIDGKTKSSCIILSSLGAEVQVRYGTTLQYSEALSRGETMVLPAALGDYRIEGRGRLLCSYVPESGDEAWTRWTMRNEVSAQ